MSAFYVLQWGQNVEIVLRGFELSSPTYLSTRRGSVSHGLTLPCAQVFIWNSNTGALEKILRDGHTAAVMAMAWHPNGAGLLSVGKDHKLALWG
eukprot:m.672527 g.672527  ORF g.672527 m.672527 type:complete len:94 (+) comp22776_c1_seq56:3-284(+)